VTFGDVATRVFALYGAKDYSAALDVVLDARTSHPEEDHTLTFWEACLVARLGRPRDAVETLQAGIARGEWWPTGKLIDTDLDPARNEPGWEQVLAHCVAMTQTLLAERPSPMVRDGTGDGTLVTIGGAHAVQEDLFTTWERATPPRWTVITPVGSEPTGDGLWEWPHSLDESAQSVINDLQVFDLVPPLILSGFSIGTAIACHVINATELAADGLIAIAPSTTATGAFEELVEAASSVRSMVIGGDQDNRSDRYRHLQSQLGESELATFKIVEGLGHAYPEDLDRRVAQFLSAF
jgi:hypothetical protein